MKPQPTRPVETPDGSSADDPRYCLSALADGDADAAQAACSLWRSDPAARRTWHAYHLIGDAMRSEELARTPAHDAAFLAGVVQRLASEPVLLAPAAPVQEVRRRQAWLMPVAAAAGFVAVAGVLVLTRLGAPGAPAPAGVLAGASGPGLTVVDAAGRHARQPPPEAGFIRDPLLDEYLRIHQAARGGVAAASPGGTLRQVDVAAPAGAQR